MIVEFIALFLIGFGIASRVAKRVVVKELPTYVTDSSHFGLGMLAATLDPVMAFTVSHIFLIYEIVTYVVKRDSVDKDIMTYLAGLVSGILGRTWLPL